MKKVLLYQILVFIAHGKTAWNISSNMKWYVWITWWIIFCIRYSRLFWVYFKKHGENVDNLLLRIHVNKIENRITFKIKTGYYHELLTPETVKLLGSTENEITKDKNGENLPHLEITEVILVHCNIVNNDYQQDSRVLYTFAPNKPFHNLLEISPKNHIFLKTFNTEFQSIEVCFPDQNSQTLEIEDQINLTLSN